MRRLQIGMWTAFDIDYWNKYSSVKINGIEISQYKNQDELNAVRGFCKTHELAFGIHTPVLANTEYTLPKVTSHASVEREEATRRITEEIRIASEYGADYVLFHYPFPPIYPTIKNHDYWTGPLFHDYYESNQIDPNQLREYSHQLFTILSELQIKYDQRVVLEYDFFGDNEDLFTEMFAKYQDIQLVVDTQRLDIHKRFFPDFNPYTWLDTVSPYVYLAHYSNVEYRGKELRRHLPVLMDQVSDSSYGDSYDYLSFLAERNNRFHVTFEHNPALVTREELQSCYEAVDRLLSNDANQ